MTTYRDINSSVRIGGGLTLPAGSITLGSKITLDNTSGQITATKFAGDGSLLTNLSSANMAGVLLLDGSRAMTGNLLMSNTRQFQFKDSGHYITHQPTGADGASLDGVRVAGWAGVEIVRADTGGEMATFRPTAAKINAPLTVTTSVTSTTINATGNLQENGTNLSAKYLQLSGGTMTGNLNVTSIIASADIFLKEAGTATSTANQWSRVLRLSGSKWNGTAAVLNSAYIQVDDSGGFYLASNGSGTNKQVMGIDNNGNTSISGSSKATSFIIGATTVIETDAKIDWNKIKNAPSTYTPSAHTHVMTDITGLAAELGDKSDVGHTHAITDVTGLQTALSGKSDTSHTHTFTSLTSKPTTLSGYGITDASLATHLHDDRYLQLSGGTLSNNLTISNAVDAKLILNADTDNDTAEGGEAKLVLTQDGGIVGVEIKTTQGNTADGTLSINPFMDYNTATPVKNYNVFIHDKKIWHEGTFTPSTKADAARKITVGTGLTGGGDFTADRAIGISFGTTTGTVAAGDHVHTFAAITSKPTTVSGYGITDAALASHTHAFSELTSKPTTLAGYGITDASLSTHNHDSVYLKMSGGTMTGILTAGGSIFTASGFDFALGTGDQTSRGDSGASRALVKGAGSLLVVNYGGDFTGGVNVQGPGLTATGQISASKFLVGSTEIIDVNGKLDWSMLKSVPATFAPSAHTHTIANVTGLQTALDGKAAAVHTHLWADITDKPTTFTPSAHTHAISDITSLQTSLNAKLDATANAVSASKWATARTLTLGGDASGSVSLDGSANATLTVTVADNSHNHTALTYIDKRDVKPADTAKNALSSYFTSLEGLSGAAGSDWQDLLVLNMYTDSSGGKVNALAFDKSQMTILHYQANQGDTTWGTAKTIAYTDSSITGNAATATSAGKWTTARTITLAGDLSGSVSIDGSANVTLTATVADDSHNHIISDVDGLQTALDGKSNTGHTHAITDVTGLQTALDGKSNTGHTHLWADITDKPSTFTPSAHTHLWADITDKPTTFTPSAHTHVLSDVTGLQAALDGKSDANHNHDSVYVNTTGDTMTGNLNFSETGEGITWSMNTDGAAIYFKNTGDSDTDSALTFETTDNGNEFFKFQAYTATVATELMTIKSDALRFKGSVVWHEANFNPTTKADKATTISVGTGLSGGGDLSANRTISPVFGSAAGTISEGNHNHDTVYVNVSGDTMTGALTLPSGAGVRALKAGSDNYSININSHSNHTWFRNEVGLWSFQQGTIGDDWTSTFQLYLPAPGSTANGVWAEIGQRQSNVTDSRYRGVRFVKYTSSATVDGDVRAGTYAVGTTTVIESDAKVDWNKIKNTPSSYTPASHTHAYTDVISIPTSSILGRVSASTGAAEALTAAQVRTLINVADGANNYTHPSGDGNLHVPATGTGNNTKVLKAGSTAGSLSWGSVAWGELTGVPSTFAPSSHTHAISDVTNLQTTLDAKVKYDDVIMNTNPFGGKRLYINSLNDAIFRATERWTVTGNFYKKSDDTLVGAISAGSLAAMFDGDYEGNMNIPAGQYAVFTIDFNGSYPGYPYGYIYLSHYYTNLSESASMRVYCNYTPQGVGWKTIAFSDFYRGGTANLITRARNDYYDISQMEFTIKAPDTTPAQITSIDWQLDRPGSVEMPLVDKYRSNNLYSPLYFKAGDRTTGITLDPNGTGAFKALTVNGTAVSLAGHAHAWSEITSKPSTFAPSAHTHAISEVTGLQTALDGKAASSHTHAISDVTGLQTALDGKSDTSHNHDSTYLKLAGGTVTGATTFNSLVTLKGQATPSDATYGGTDVSLSLEHASGGSSSIYFKSGVNFPSDYGYIRFEDSTAVSGESGRLTIGIENDGATDHVQIKARTIINSDNISSDPTDIVEFQSASVYKGKIDASGNLYLAGNITLTGTVDGVDLSAFKTAYDNHNHDTLYLGKTAKAADSSLLNGQDSSYYATSTHTHTNTVSRGSVTAETGIARPAVNGMSMSEAYNNGYPITYGNVLNLSGTGKGQLLIGWSGTSAVDGTTAGTHENAYIRSQRDSGNSSWSPWAKIWTDANFTPGNYVGTGANQSVGSGLTVGGTMYLGTTTSGSNNGDLIVRGGGNATIHLDGDSSGSINNTVKSYISGTGNATFAGTVTANSVAVTSSTMVSNLNAELFQGKRLYDFDAPISNVDLVGYGVISGLKPKQNGIQSPDNAVRIEPGVVYTSSGRRFEFTTDYSATVSASQSFDRWDIFYVRGPKDGSGNIDPSNEGTIQYMAGTSNGVVPTPPVGSVLIAKVLIKANTGSGTVQDGFTTTAVTPNLYDIRQWRPFVYDGTWFNISKSVSAVSYMENGTLLEAKYAQLGIDNTFIGKQTVTGGSINIRGSYNDNSIPATLGLTEYDTADWGFRFKYLGADNVFKLVSVEAGVETERLSITRSNGFTEFKNDVQVDGKLTAKKNAVTLTIPAGQTSVTWTHNYGVTTYAVNPVSNSFERHVRWNNKMANTISIEIDTPTTQDILVDCILIGY